jgi:hypothetical protein
MMEPPKSPNDVDRLLEDFLQMCVREHNFVTPIVIAMIGRNGTQVSVSRYSSEGAFEILAGHIEEVPQFPLNLMIIDAAYKIAHLAIEPGGARRERVFH